MGTKVREIWGGVVVNKKEEGQTMQHYIGVLILTPESCLGSRILRETEPDPGKVWRG